MGVVKLAAQALQVDYFNNARPQTDRSFFVGFRGENLLESDLYGLRPAEIGCLPVGAKRPIGFGQPILLLRSPAENVAQDSAKLPDFGRFLV
jgi:hypothetical protein